MLIIDDWYYPFIPVFEQIRKFQCFNFIVGPENWGSIREEWEIADTGENQSPIDLSDAVPETYAPLEFTDAYFEDIEGALFNNGHTGE